MQWRINVLVFEQLCPGSAIRQQEGGTGILQPRICQSQCICLNVSWSLSLHCIIVL